MRGVEALVHLEHHCIVLEIEPGRAAIKWRRVGSLVQRGNVVVDFLEGSSAPRWVNRRGHCAIDFVHVRCERHGFPRRNGCPRGCNLHRRYHIADRGDHRSNRQAPGGGDGERGEKEREREHRVEIKEEELNQLQTGRSHQINSDSVKQYQVCKGPIDQ